MVLGVLVRLGASLNIIDIVFKITLLVLSFSIGLGIFFFLIL